MKLMLCILLNITILAQEPIRVGVFEVAPFGYRTKDGKVTGVIHKLLKGIEKESGLKFTFDLQPYRRVIMSLQSGKVDLVIAYPSKSYKNKFKSIAPTLGSTNYIVTKKNIVLNKMSDIRKYRTAIIRGAKYSVEFDSIRNLKVANVKNYKQSYEMLLKDRVDAIVISSGALTYYSLASNHNIDEKFNLFKINHQYNWLHVHKE